MSAALPPLEPPTHVRLRHEDRQFWAGIIASRVRDEWTEAGLVVAAQLARCQRDIEAESETLESEGSVLVNDRGTPIQNPRHAVLEQLARREMALMRCLRIGGSALGGDREDLEKARRLHRQAAAARKDLCGEAGDLLAT